MADPNSLFNHFSKAVHFSMRFPDIQIPGNGHVTVDMQYISEFYHPQIMDIDPVGQPAVIDEVNHF